MKGYYKQTVTRKDYIKIASALNTAYRADGLLVTRAAVVIAAHKIADELENDNTRFNRSHFLAAVRGEVTLTSRPPRQRRS